jgi:hypothetical protein
VIISSETQLGVGRSEPICRDPRTSWQVGEIVPLPNFALVFASRAAMVLSRFTLFDVAAGTFFAGLPATASRAL